jgi:NADH-quinone oxidoreductase subunit G
MSTNKVNLEIDGKKVQADLGSMIIEAADNNEVYIPRFCYHKKLSIAANCRMCLIEIEGMKKAVPACATPITEGMKVRTRSELARKAQKAVMEFLLINHPLDCPICDQGGQCELQDLAVGFGQNESQYIEKKRVVVDENLGPLISTDMTRCIYCTRCVRFLQEVAGKPELGTMGRGEHTEISTLIESNINSEVSGNIIDLCPVGALTSKPFRFSARAWELQQRPLIAAHDCLGSNINVQFINNTIKRVAPRPNESVNETWLSDRDRFSYEGINSDERLLQPMVKRDGQWETLDWTTALEIVASSLENVRTTYGADAVGGLISANATLEEHYLFQKVLREFGSNNIDYRVQQLDFSGESSAPYYPSLGLPVAELSECDVVLLVGSDIQREQPVLALRLIKGAKEGLQISSINSYDYAVNFAQKVNSVVAPQQLPQELAGVLTALAQAKATPVNAIDNVTVSATAARIAEQLAAGKKIAIILGASAQNHDQYATISALAQQIAQLSGASFGVLTQGANAAGASLASAILRNKHGKTGLHAQALFNEPRKAYCLFNLEPEFDCANPGAAINALTKADFVVSFTPFVSEAMRAYADVLLPIAPFAETMGTLVNCNGLWQSFNAAVPARGEARPGWKVLRVLGNFFELPNFEYQSCAQIHSEVEQLVKALPELPATVPGVPALRSGNLGSNLFTRYSDWPIYRSDNVVRRSAPLQAMPEHNNFSVRINPSLAQQLNIGDQEVVVLKQGDYSCEALVQLDNNVAANTVYVPAATSTSAKLGAAFGAIEIVKKVRV